MVTANDAHGKLLTITPFWQIDCLTQIVNILSRIQNDTSISEYDNMDYSLYGKCQLIDETGGKPFKIADAILTPQGKCLVRIFA